MARWSEFEVDLLHNLSSKFELKQLSKILNRSPHSVSYKLRSLKISCVKSRKEFNVRWSDEMLNEMKKMKEEDGLSWETIADRIGKSKHACQRKYLRTFGKKESLDFEKLKKELNSYFWNESLVSDVLEIVKSCQI